MDGDGERIRKDLCAKKAGRETRLLALIASDTDEMTVFKTNKKSFQREALITSHAIQGVI